MILYECEVTTEHHFEDWECRPRIDYETETCSHKTLDALYLNLASLKTDETPVDQRTENYTVVEFGPIRVLEVLKSSTVDTEILNETFIMQAHNKKLEEERERVRIWKEKAEAEKVARELAELHRLQEKYGK